MGKMRGCFILFLALGATLATSEYVNRGKYDCYPGVDIVTFTRGSKSLEKCKTECNKNDKCKYIMSVSGSHCVLKTSGCINVRKENSSVNLYEKRVKSSTSTTTSSKEYINIGKYDCYPGVDIVTFTRGSKSLEKCKTECNKNDKCKYIMSVSGSHCVLKTSGCINV